MSTDSEPIEIEAARFALPDARVQGAIGLTLAAAIAGSWLAIHAFAMFVFELSWTTWPIALAMAKDSILVIIKMDKTVVQNSTVSILLKLGCKMESIILSGISNNKLGPTS